MKKAICCYHFFFFIYSTLPAQSSEVPHKFRFFHENPRWDYCNLRFYTTIESKYVVRAENPRVNKVSSVNIVADSFYVKKVNDSVYIFKYLGEPWNRLPKKIFFVDKISSKKIDSNFIRIEDHPFSFSIIPYNDPNSIYSRRLQEIVKLFYWTGSECYDYTREYSIISYNLVFKRGDSLIFDVPFKGNEVYSTQFKNVLLDLKREENCIYATDIILQNKRGSILKIDSYLVMYIK